MDIRRNGALLVGGTALALLMAGPAAAQNCAQKIDDVAQKVQQANLSSQDQEYAQSAIENARTLADQGLEQACMQTLAQIGDRTGIQVAVGQMSGAEEAAATGQQGQQQAQGGQQGQQQTQKSAQQGQKSGQQGQQAQKSGQQGQQQAQGGQQGGASGKVGTGTLDAPEWQVYSGMETKYGPLAWLTFDEVVGADVTGADGAAIGEILELVKAEGEDMIYAVVDATAADKLVAVPVNELEVQGEDRQIVLTGALEDLPTYQSDR